MIESRSHKEVLADIEASSEQIGEAGMGGQRKRNEEPAEYIPDIEEEG